MSQRTQIDDLLSRRLLVDQNGYYLPTLSGLRAAGTDRARGALRRCDTLISLLKEKVQGAPDKSEWTAEELAMGSTFSAEDLRVFLTIILVSGEYRIHASWGGPSGSPFASHIQIALDGVLDAPPVQEDESPDISGSGGPIVVSRLYIHNFRSFVNFEWKPPGACVLVGENGAGKSALLQSIWILQDLLVHGLPVTETHLDGAQTRWLSEPEQTIELEIGAGEGTTYHYRLVVRDEKPKPTIREELRFGADVLYRADGGQVELFGDVPSSATRSTIAFDRKRSFIAALEARPDNRRLTTFRRMVGSLQALKPEVHRIEGTAREDGGALKRDLSNFPSWYLSRIAEDPEAAANLWDALKRAMKGFAALRFERISPKTRSLVVRFSFGGSNYDLPWTELSDGQRMLIILYGLLHLGLSDASFIAVDEAENYLAPAEIQPWFRAIGDMANERHQQWLFISHHPEPINYLASDAIWRMWRDGDAGHTRIEELVPDDEAGVTAYDALKLQLAMNQDP